MKSIKYRQRILVPPTGKEEQGREIFYDIQSPWNSQTEEIAKAEAYNGEYTIEDIPMTAEAARAQRDKLLEDTDWTQVLDAPIDTETREAYRVYRQALRDVPQQDGFPDTIIWPTRPVTGSGGAK